MQKKEKPLAGVRHSRQQGAENNKADGLSLQDNSCDSAGQEQAPQGNTAAIQRQKILARLSHGPFTTLQAREQLDIMHPAARVMELRKSGHDIQTVWVWDLSPFGKPHRVARYILKRGE